MAKTLTSGLINQKNKLNSRDPWLIAADIAVPGGTEYIINNNESLTWGGNTYEPFNFTFGTIPSRSTGELPEVAVTMFNSADFATYIGANNGLIGYDVDIHLIYATRTAGVWGITESQTNYPLKQSYVIIDCVPARDSIAFVLGVPNYLRRTCPGRLYRKDWCDYVYKGDYCWMNGRTVVSEPDTCDHTYSNCSAHYNDQSRPSTGIGFGGCPNLGKGSYVYR